MEIENPQALWAILPSVCFILLICIVIFIVIRRLSKRKQYNRILDEAYGSGPTGITVIKDPPATTETSIAQETPSSTVPT